jgi:hypothetical protein
MLRPGTGWYCVCERRGVAQAVSHEHSDPRAADVYREILWHLREAGIPYLVGGTYALEHHAGLVRDTKDLDLFVRRADWSRISEALAPERITCELVFSHWLGKAHRNGLVVDMIFAGGNGLVEVSDDWFTHAVPSFVLDVPVHLVTAEDMIWSKAFVMERERYDGADVAHLLHACAGSLDWDRLSQRFAKHWRILLMHLILFGFIYPSERRRIPEAVMRECLRLLDHEMRRASSRRICRGTLTSRAQYLVDLELWGYEDARLAPHGSMSEEDTSIWTAAIDAEASRPLGERPREADAPDDLPAGRTTNGSM